MSTENILDLALSFREEGSVSGLGSSNTELGQAVKQMLEARRAAKNADAAEDIGDLLECMDSELKTRASNVRAWKKFIQQAKDFEDESKRRYAWAKATNNFIPLGEHIGFTSHPFGAENYRAMARCIPEDWKEGDAIPEKWLPKQG